RSRTPGHHPALRQAGSQATAGREKVPRAEAETMTPPKPRSFSQRWGMALPLLIFALLSGLFWYALHSGDPSRLPSALVGKTVPPFPLPPIEGSADAERFHNADLAQGAPDTA